MKEQFYFSDSPAAYSGEEGVIFTASNGQGYVENGELHICGNYHLVYKFAGEPAGWYMKNPADNIDRYLGDGACPSVLIEDINVQDATYFEAIKYVQPEQEDLKGKKHNK